MIMFYTVSSSCQKCADRFLLPCGRDEFYTELKSLILRGKTILVCATDSSTAAGLTGCRSNL